jgi:hypothetical protein
MKLRQRDRHAAALRERQHMIRQGFHSRPVFETYLKMVDQDCQRIRGGLLGKSQFKEKSVWENASENAPPDEANISKRREFWWRFSSFVRFLGGLHERQEKKFVKLVRAKLMLRHEVNHTLFWDIVKEFDPADMENVATLRLIEFCRMVLGIPQHEVGTFLDEQGEAGTIYGQTIVSNLSREYMDTQRQLATGPITVPDCDWPP